MLRDRRLLSDNGIFIAVISIDKKKKEIVAGPEIQSRGFVYVKESEALLKEAELRILEIVNNHLATSKLDWNDLKQEIRDDLNKFLYENTKRNPMIIPIISEI